MNELAKKIYDRMIARAQELTDDIENADLDAVEASSIALQAVAEELADIRKTTGTS